MEPPNWHVSMSETDLSGASRGHVAGALEVGPILSLMETTQNMLDDKIEPEQQADANIQETRLV